MSEDRRDYAVLISLAMREEAEVAAAALRADGIDAFIGNVHHAAIEWGIVPALGGVQVMVPSASLGVAKESLQDRIASAALTDYEPAPRRDRYKAWLMIWFVGGLWFGVDVFDRQSVEGQRSGLYGQAEMQRALLQLCADADRYSNSDSIIGPCRGVR